MRVIITAFWSGVSLLILVYSASAKMDYTIGGELDSPQYTHLIDTNQSQTFEPMSTSLKNFPHLASVRFIAGKSKMEFGDMEFSDETITYCAKSGYQKRVSDCTSAGLNPANICPYNREYTDLCCDKSHKYNKDDCAYPLTLGTACGGKYQCYCDRNLFPYGNDKICETPKAYDLSGSCFQEGKTYYARCLCPETYNETCQGMNQQGKGAACTHNGETKYATCQCKTGYTLTCSDYGPTNPNDYCELNGVKYYKTCKDCSAPNGYYENCKANQTITGTTEVCDKVYQACRNVAVGDVYYSDHTFTTADNLLKTATTQPIGVVFKVGNGFNGVIALTEQKKVFATDWDEKSLPKSPKGFAAKGFDSGKSFSTYYIKNEWAENGKENTAAIMQHGVDYDYYPQAAGYCYNYKTEGTCPGDWYLPSTNEIYKNIYSNTGTKDNVDKINDALTKIKAAGVPADKLFVSSSKLWTSVPCYMYAGYISAHIYNYKNATATYSANNANYNELLPVRPAMYTNSVCANNVVYKQSCVTSTTYTEKSCPYGFVGVLTDTEGRTCYRCIKAGDFLFSDRTIGFKNEAGKTVIGIVADPEKQTAVALKLSGEIAWSDEFTDTPIPNGKGASYAEGQVYTQSLVDFAAAWGKSYPAAQKAIEYEPVGCSGAWCSKGNWYLGSYQEYTPLKIKEMDALCPVPDKEGWSWSCGDIAYTLYNYNGANLHDTQLWTSNESSKSYVYSHNGSSLNKASSYKVLPMINYGTGGTCGEDSSFDKNLSLENTGYSCLSCKNSSGVTKYICECTDTTVKTALSSQGFDNIINVDICPLYGTCSPQMCNNKYYLKGCQRANGTLSTTFEDGDRLYCMTTNTCDKIQFRSDAQGVHDGVIYKGDTVIIPVTGMISPCDKCSLAGYFSSQPSGKVCEKETIGGKTCYKRCCTEGYSYNESTKQCIKCPDGTVFDEIDNMCHYCKNPDYYYSVEEHKCLKITSQTAISAQTPQTAISAETPQPAISYQTPQKESVYEFAPQPSRMEKAVIVAEPRPGI